LHPAHDNQARQGKTCRCNQQVFPPADPGEGKKARQYETESQQQTAQYPQGRMTCFLQAADRCPQAQKKHQAEQGAGKSGGNEGY
jgi:hypothetical protein